MKSLKVLFLFAVIMVLFGFVGRALPVDTISGFTSGPILQPASVAADLSPGAPLESVSGPDKAYLSPRIPYHLLNGVIPNAPVDDQINSKMNSCSCYGTDFANRIQLTGNYIQMTNNYKRKNPDSCTAPYHELVNNFYKVETMK
jgi:hypothetical protein